MFSRTLILAVLLGLAAVAAAFGQTAAFTYSPADPYTGEQVTFTTTSCGTGCRYQWADRPPGGGSWALHSGERLTPTLVFTFSGAGTKYVAVRKRTSSIAGWGRLDVRERFGVAVVCGRDSCQAGAASCPDTYAVPVSVPLRLSRLPRRLQNQPLPRHRLLSLRLPPHRRLHRLRARHLHQRPVLPRRRPRRLAVVRPARRT